MTSEAVHERHCCPRHGCKYGDDDCPVEKGGLAENRGGPCEICDDHGPYLTGHSQGHPYPRDGARVPILVHPEVRERLVSLLMRPEMRAVGYNEFVIRALDAAERELT